MTARSMLLATVVSIALAPTWGCSAPEADTTTPAKQSDAARTISFADAITTALEKVPDGIPVEVEVERKAGRDLLEVELVVDEGIREVYIDPATGEIVDVADEALDDAGKAAAVKTRSLLEGAEVSLTDAAAIARKEVPGDVLEVEYALVDDTLLLEVAVRKGDETTQVVIDPVSGSVLRVGEQDRRPTEEYEEHEEHEEHEDEHEGEEHDEARAR